MVISACGASLTAVEPPSEPGGTVAVPFTLEFEPGHWDSGSHAYRLALECPQLGTTIEPPVVRFDVDPSAPHLADPVWLRFDGLSTTSLSPADLAAIHPGQATVAVMTVVGLTGAEAEVAVEDCSATVVYDGKDPERLPPAEPFIP